VMVQKIKNLLKLSVVAGAAMALMACQSSDSNAVKVGVIVPIEHKAMDEIVDGFKASLEKQYAKPVKVKVANAQGDANIQRAQIQQMRDQGYAVIAAVGKEPTLMAMSMVKRRPIVGIAANISQTERTSYKNCNLALVHDEIMPAMNIAFIHAAYPELKNLVLVHSAADNVYQEVKSFTIIAE
jgi:putative ABC transport system substrate-binding protein